MVMGMATKERTVTRRKMTRKRRRKKRKKRRKKRKKGKRGKRRKRTMNPPRTHTIGVTSLRVHSCSLRPTLPTHCAPPAFSSNLPPRTSPSKIKRKYGRGRQTRKAKIRARDERPSPACWVRSPVGATTDAYRGRPRFFGREGFGRGVVVSCAPDPI